MKTVLLYKVFVTQFLSAMKNGIEYFIWSDKKVAHANWQVQEPPNKLSEEKSDQAKVHNTLFLSCIFKITSKVVQLSPYDWHAREILMLLQNQIIYSFSLKSTCS